MPLKRTPPKTDTNSDSATYHTTGSDLTNNSATDSQSMQATGVTFRNKRKHDTEFREELKLLREDMMSMFAALRQEQNDKFLKLQNNLEEIITLNTELRTSVQYVSDKYDELLDKIKIIDSERNTCNEQLQALENKFDHLEKSMKSSTIEIRNLPKRHGETPDDLVTTIQNIGEAIDIQIGTQDVRNIYRLTSKKPQTTGPVVVNFNCVQTKEKLISKIKQHNKINPNNKFNSSHIKLEGKTPIYITESLTSKTKNIFYKAREFSKANNYAFCWVAHGNVYLRKKEGVPARRVDSELDLRKLKIDS